jgi:hypothetical protein
MYYLKVKKTEKSLKCKMKEFKMGSSKLGTFEMLLVIVSLTVTILGFQLINTVYQQQGTVDALLLITIFNWLTLLVMFILLSITVDVSKKQLDKLEVVVSLLTKKKI